MLYSKRSARIIAFAVGAGVFASPHLFPGMSSWGCVVRVSDARPLDVPAERVETPDSRRAQAPESGRIQQEEVGALKTWWAGELTVLEAPPEVPLGPATDLDEHVEVRRVLEHRVEPGR